MVRAHSGRSRLASATAFVLVVASLGCATTGPLAGGRSEQVGIASYYGREHDGLRTASGEIFDMNQLTAAHRSLPFGTRLRVTNRDNNQSTEVRINDRGPFVKGRILDVSYAAARQLGALGAGTFPVRLRVVALPTTGADATPRSDLLTSLASLPSLLTQPSLPPPAFNRP
jgi:peptidoglycan lytic transglycosylase